MHIWEQIPQRERRDLLIAWLALSAAFTVANIGTTSLYPEQIAVMFLISTVTAGVAFIVHEMAHKFTAMKHGYWAEFQMNPTMLVVAVAVAALTKIVFAAPGATMIYGNHLSQEENGKISLAGPLSNLILILPLLGLFIIGIVAQIPTLTIIGLKGIQINSYFAAFNLLPLGPLDGVKILEWNSLIYIAMVLLSFGIVYGSSMYYIPVTLMY